MLYFFLILGLSAFIASIRSFDRIVSTLYLLFSIGVIFFLSANILEVESSQKLTFVLSAMISFSFLLSFWKSESNFLGFLSLLLPSILLFFVWDYPISVGDYSFNLGLTHIFLVVFGASIPLLSGMKTKVIAGIFKIEDRSSLQFSFELFLLGFGIFIASFFASYIGVLFLSLGILMASFRNNNYSLVNLSLIYGLATTLLNLGNVTTIDFTLGKVVFGFFAGVFAVSSMYGIKGSKRFYFFGLILLLLIHLIIASTVLWLGTQKNDLGGTDSFIALLIGAAVTQLFLINKLVDLAYLSILVGLGIKLIPTTVNAEELQSTKIIVNTVQSKADGKSIKNDDPFQLKGMDITEISGKYKINEETVQLTFELGPKGGITKGVFKTFSGSVEIPETVSNSKFKVILPVDKLTTFNSYRDESLMEKAYFDVTKFPKMEFSSDNLTVKGDEYILSGKFKMLGIEQSLDVRIKYVGNNTNGAPVLIGKSSIDRTRFGMKPDSKEGNVVNFIFKIELLKIK